MARDKEIKARLSIEGKFANIQEFKALGKQLQDALGVNKISKEYKDLATQLSKIRGELTKIKNLGGVSGSVGVATAGGAARGAARPSAPRAASASPKIIDRTRRAKNQARTILRNLGMGLAEAGQIAEDRRQASATLRRFTSAMPDAAIESARETLAAEGVPPQPGSQRFRHTRTGRPISRQRFYAQRAWHRRLLMQSLGAAHPGQRLLGPGNAGPYSSAIGFRRRFYGPSAGAPGFTAGTEPTIDMTQDPGGVYTAGPPGGGVDPVPPPRPTMRGGSGFWASGAGGQPIALAKGASFTDFLRPQQNYRQMFRDAAIMAAGPAAIFGGMARGGPGVAASFAGLGGTIGSGAGLLTGALSKRALLAAGGGKAGLMALGRMGGIFGMATAGVAGLAMSPLGQVPQALEFDLLRRQIAVGTGNAAMAQDIRGRTPMQFLDLSAAFGGGRGLGGLGFTGQQIAQMSLQLQQQNFVPANMLMTATNVAGTMSRIPGMNGMANVSAMMRARSLGAVSIKGATDLNNELNAQFKNAMRLGLRGAERQLYFDAFSSDTAMLEQFGSPLSTFPRRRTLPTGRAEMAVGNQFKSAMSRLAMGGVPGGIGGILAMQEIGGLKIGPGGVSLSDLDAAAMNLSENARRNFPQLVRRMGGMVNQSPAAVAGMLQSQFGISMDPRRVHQILVGSDPRNQGGIETFEAAAERGFGRAQPEQETSIEQRARQETKRLTTALESTPLYLRWEEIARQLETMILPKLVRALDFFDR